jgi:hypothetical protein
MVMKYLELYFAMFVRNMFRVPLETLLVCCSVEVRHIHLQPTEGEWRQQQVWKEVWQQSPHGEWKQEWKQEWANVRVPGQKWHR